MQGEIDDLLHQLDEAFGGLPIPADHAVVYDNSGDHLECNQVRELFKGRHWREFSVDELLTQGDALSFFTNEAYRFYLPAFIRAAVLNFEEADLIPDHVLWSLAEPAYSTLGNQPSRTLEIPGKPRSILSMAASEIASAVSRGRDYEIERRQQQRRESLSEQQKQAVLAFVAYLRRHWDTAFPSDELEAVEEALDRPEPGPLGAK